MASYQQQHWVLGGGLRGPRPFRGGEKAGDERWEGSLLPWSFSMERAAFVIRLQSSHPWGHV